jgi:hypothetical protein
MGGHHAYLPPIQSAKPIDTKQWKQRDHKVKIEKFIATAVKMPGEFNPAEPSRQLIHWCVH